MSDKEKKDCNILGLNTNYTLSDVENAYKVAKEAWSINEFAPEELKQRSKVQLDKIDEAYEYIKKHFKELMDNVSDKSDKLIDSIKQGNTNTNPSNEEYSNFNIETSEVEFSRAKIRNWWRIILIIVLFFFICFNVPSEDSSEPQQNEKTNTQQTFKQKPEEQNIQKENIKQEANIQEKTKNDESTVENKESNIENKQTKQITEEKVTNNEKQVSTTQNEVKSKTSTKTETVETKQNTKNQEKKEVPTSKSDFNAVSDYFD